MKKLLFALLTIATVKASAVEFKYYSVERVKQNSSFATISKPYIHNETGTIDITDSVVTLNGKPYELIGSLTSDSTGTEIIGKYKKGRDKVIIRIVYANSMPACVYVYYPWITEHYIADLNDK